MHPLFSAPPSALPSSPASSELVSAVQNPLVPLGAVSALPPQYPSIAELHYRRALDLMQRFPGLFEGI